MTNSDHAFTQELEVFRTESEASVQFLYAYLAVHSTAAKSSQVVDLLNTAPLFWNTALGALQTSAFIAVGRIYDDDDGSHGLKRLLKLAESDPKLFTLEALAIRKQGDRPTRPDWLDGYLKDAYVPSRADFTEMRRCADEKYAIYKSNYKKIRNKVFAHKDRSDEIKIHQLFEKTNISELQGIVLFLLSLYDALWQLYFNGVKPVLREYNHSISSILDKPLPAGQQLPPHEKISRETEEFLTGMAYKS